MENIPVTAYSGFSNVRGEITLRKVIENITKGIHAKLIFKIRLLVSQGKMEEANNVKNSCLFIPLQRDTGRKGRHTALQGIHTSSYWILTTNLKRSWKD